MKELFDQLRGFVRALWAYRWWGLAGAVLVGIVGSGVVMTIPNQYEARARIFVDTQSVLKPLMSGLAVQPNLDEQIAMMGRTLINRPNVERVIRMADLDLKVRTPEEREALVDAVMKGIVFQGSGRVGRTLTNIYSISYRSQNPETARKVVQALLTIFVESNLGNKRRDSEQARRFIDDQIKVYEQRLLDAENALKEFKLKHMNVMPSLAQDSVSRFNALQQELASARLELRQAENARDAIKRELAGEVPTFTSEQAVEAQRSIPSELDQRIEAQRKRLDELRLRYTEQHPDVAGTQRVLQQLEAQRDAERRAAAKDGGTVSRTLSQSNPVFQQLRMTLTNAETRVAELRVKVGDAEARLAQARTLAQTIPEVEAEFTQLNRDYDVNKKNYEMLLARREAAQLSGDMESSGNMADFRVIDPPRASAQPVAPNRPLLLLGVLLGSLGAGAAIALLRDQIRPTFFDLRGLREFTGMPMLGAVTLVSSDRASRRDRLSTVAFSGTALAYVGLFAVVVAWLWFRQMNP
jgi:polysaccharide chain length determinant protein (PEP-CTERM system associated)